MQPREGPGTPRTRWWSGRHRRTPSTPSHYVATAFVREALPGSAETRRCQERCRVPRPTCLSPPARTLSSYKELKATGDVILLPPQEPTSPGREVHGQGGCSGGLGGRTLRDWVPQDHSAPASDNPREIIVALSRCHDGSVFSDPGYGLQHCFLVRSCQVAKFPHTGGCAVLLCMRHMNAKCGRETGPSSSLFSKPLMDNAIVRPRNPFGRGCHDHVRRRTGDGRDPFGRGTHGATCSGPSATARSIWSWVPRPRAAGPGHGQIRFGRGCHDHVAACRVFVDLVSTVWGLPRPQWCCEPHCERAQSEA